MGSEMCIRDSYYNSVYKIEVRFPSGSEEVQRDYLLSETDRISKSFQRNLAFYQYHRTKATYLDRQYFMRGKPDIQIIVDSFYYETDPQFSTSHDTPRHGGSRKNAGTAQTSSGKRFSPARPLRKWRTY